MTSTIRLYVRTGIVGAWAVFFGAALLVAAERLLTTFDPEPSGKTTLATAGVPIFAMTHGLLEGLYDGGAASVLVGLVLVFAGWYQLLRMM